MGDNDFLTNIPRKSIQPSDCFTQSARSSQDRRCFGYTPRAMAAESMETPSDWINISQLTERGLLPPDDIPTPPASCSHKYRIDVVERLVRADFSGDRR